MVTRALVAAVHPAHAQAEQPEAVPGLLAVLHPGDVKPLHMLTAVMIDLVTNLAVQTARSALIAMRLVGVITDQMVFSDAISAH